MKRYNGNKKSATYTKFIGILSHLIYTKPLAVKALLNEYGVGIDGEPTYKELISATVELLSQQDKGFESDFGELVTLHIKNNSDELMSYDEDSFFGGIVGGLAKGLIGGIGSIFKKKRRPRHHAPRPVVSNVKNDMAQQMARIRAEEQRREAKRRAERERKEEERRIRKEEKEERERRERKEEQKAKEAASAKQTKMIMMVVGGVVVLGAAVMLLKPKPVPVVPA